MREQPGFTTIELLIASALLLIVVAAVAALAMPMRDAVERSLGRSDLTGGSRFALQRLAADVREAGSPASVVAGGPRLDALLPTIVVLQDLDSGGSQPSGRAVRTVAVPFLAAQGVLGATAAAGTVFLRLDPARPCTAVGLACGFRTGMSALLYDATRATVVSVASVTDGGVVQVAAPIATTFGPGAVLAAVTTTSYGLRPESDGSWRLVRVRSGSEQPVLDHVVDFAIAIAGPDLTPVNRVDVRLRLEAASAALRGPAGYLFRRAGTSTRARQMVPDVELRASIALRVGGS
jgi:Tfp pilus assembly protein PilW